MQKIITATIDNNFMSCAAGQPYAQTTNPIYLFYKDKGRKILKTIPLHNIWTTNNIYAQANWPACPMDKSFARVRPISQ